MPTDLIVVGGVGQLYLGDRDVGRHVAERLGDGSLGADVAVEDFYYGALAVAQQLQDLQPAALVLVGATERGRRPGTVTCHAVGDLRLTTDEAQGAVHDAGTGYVSLELVVEVAWALGGLPAATVTVEIEPANSEPAEQLSPTVAQALEEALAVVRHQVVRLRASLADR